MVHMLVLVNICVGIRLRFSASCLNGVTKESVYVSLSDVSGNKHYIMFSQCKLKADSFINQHLWATLEQNLTTPRLAVVALHFLLA